MITVVHAADLHIDSPLRGLGRVEGAPTDDLRLATRKAFTRLVDTCLEEQAALLVLAGDVFDGEWRDFNTGLFFVRELARLQAADTQVVMVRGNHDAESVLARHIPLPANVHTFSPDAPETREYPRLGLAVHGQSYGSRSVDDNLADAYPDPVPDLLNIGVLHTNAVGDSGHGNYAPCTVGQLVRHGYDYWALGHVHRRQILSRAPWVVYPGNLQGRHVHESGAKGCTVIRIDDLRIRQVEHRDMDVLRWAEIVVSADNATHLDDVLAQIRVRMQQALAAAGPRPVLARVVVEGTTPLHAALAANAAATLARVRVLAAELGELWTEKILFRTRPPLTEGNSLLQTLQDELRRLVADPAALADLAAELDPLATSAAPWLGHRLDDPQRVAARLADVEALLLARLGAGPVPKASLDRHAPPAPSDAPRPEARHEV
ncbi:MAG: DNA repair exonuclease [Myxococcales bacterium]|nr:DNA repair exonuclease [Myxococcales bacterium]